MDYATKLALIGAGIGMFGGVAGGILSGAYQHIRDRTNRPKLKLRFDPIIDKLETAWKGEHPFDGLVLRASVRNDGRDVAKNCRVYLVSLTAQHHDATTPTALIGSRQIAWAGWSYEPRAIQKGLVFYADFARVSKATPGWTFTFNETMAKDQELGDYRGTYNLRLAAVADNAEPSFIDIGVDYNGDWHNLRAWAKQLR